MLPSSLQKKAYESIHDMIIKNDLSKGDVTSEVHLSQLLGMSRTPIRSALQRLELEGFLRIIPKQGVLILDQSAQKVGDLIDIIAAVLLFTITSLHHSKLLILTTFMADQDRSFHTLISKNANHSVEISKALCDFEYSMILGLIDLIHNNEMNQLFSQTSNRLYWHNNTRRWNPPHFKSSIACFQELFQGILNAELTVFETIHPYIQLLKKTWT
jgi:DNA-binding transcriptional MocR family regulator